MQLIARCGALKARMRTLQAARLNVSTREVIVRRLEEWNRELEPIEHGCRQLQWLGVAVEQDAALERLLGAVRVLATEARTLLKDTHNIEAVRRGGDENVWTRLLAAAKSCGEALTVTVQRHWRDAVRRMGDFESPKDLAARVTITPENEIALKKYESCWQAYRLLAGADRPRSERTLDQLAQHTATLRSAFGRIDFDVPSEVQAFFAALASGGAGLELINPRLIDWLRTHGQLDRYVVRDRQG